jgi:CRISPR/Cas system CSM-associated protein Csm2 small subunit
MIIDKVEKNGIVEAIYESSNIIASTYNQSDKTLNIIFKHGGSYSYSNVENTDYIRFETAESQGKVLNSNIKKYAFIKNENVDTSEVIDRIKKLKQEEIESFKEVIFKLLKENTSSYENIGKFSSLNKLNKSIVAYNKLLD